MRKYYRLEKDGKGPYQWYAETPLCTPYWFGLQALLSMTDPEQMPAPEFNGTFTLDPKAHIFACPSMEALEACFSSEGLDYAVSSLGFTVSVYNSAEPPVWAADTQCVLDRSQISLNT